MGKPSIDIIIPNWNGKDLLAEYLPSVLRAYDHLPALTKQVTVIDDGSTDGSADYIRTTFPQVTLIRNEKNIGFHRSVNKAVAASTCAIVLLLNSDIAPEPDAFTCLYNHFCQDRKGLFAVSGRIYSGDKQHFLYGNRGGVLRWGHFFLKEKPEFATSQTLFACGGAGAYWREYFLALGGFDTLFYPFYYEEQDISYRALKRGLAIDYEPASVMYHRVQASIGKKLKRDRIRRISARNNYLFIMKNITDWRYVLAFMLCTPLGILWALLKGNPRFLIAFLMTIPRIPEALMKRWQEKKYYVKNDREIFAAVNKP